jgi:hypothetical protein
VYFLHSQLQLKPEEFNEQLTDSYNCADDMNDVFRDIICRTVYSGKLSMLEWTPEWWVDHDRLKYATTRFGDMGERILKAMDQVMIQHYNSIPKIMMHCKEDTFKRKSS